MKSILFTLLAVFLSFSVAKPIKDIELNELPQNMYELQKSRPFKDDYNRKIFLQRNLDPSGNPYSILDKSRKFYQARNLDALGGGNILRSIYSNEEYDDLPEYVAQRMIRSNGKSRLPTDPLGGGNLVKRTINSFK